MTKVWIYHCLQTWHKTSLFPIKYYLLLQLKFVLEFFIEGKPEVTLTGVRSEIDIIKKHLGNGRYYCTYIPVLPGGYLLHITWNNRQLKGSPYKVSVIAAAQPQKVNVTGEGLEGGILGKELQVNIDTRKAGPGE